MFVTLPWPLFLGRMAGPLVADSWLSIRMLQQLTWGNVHRWLRGEDSIRWRCADRRVHDVHVAPSQDHHQHRQEAEPQLAELPASATGAGSESSTAHAASTHAAAPWHLAGEPEARCTDAQPAQPRREELIVQRRALLNRVGLRSLQSQSEMMVRLKTIS